MVLYTKESLEKVFRESKLRQERKRLKAQLEKKEKKRLQEILDKNSLRSERKKAMDNLSNLLKKTPQEPLKPSITPFYASYHLNEVSDSDLYSTWDELKEAENRHEGKINWYVIKKVIEDTKEEIYKFFKKY